MHMKLITLPIQSHKSPFWLWTIPHKGKCVEKKFSRGESALQAMKEICAKPSADAKYCGLRVVDNNGAVLAEADSPE